MISAGGCVQDSPPPALDHTFSILVGLLDDEQSDVRWTAVESLGKIGDPRAIAHVIPVASDSSALVRAAAVKALGRLGGVGREAALPTVLRAFSDDSEPVRRAAAEVIGEVEPPAGLLQSLSGLLASTDVRVRRAAAKALWGNEAIKSADALLIAARDSDALVRQNAVAALGELGLDAAHAILVERALHDPHSAVRTQAVYQLSRMAGEETSRRALQRAAQEDPDEGVRRWARTSLGNG